MHRINVALGLGAGSLHDSIRARLRELPVKGHRRGSAPLQMAKNTRNTGFRQV